METIKTNETSNFSEPTNNLRFFNGTLQQLWNKYTLNNCVIVDVIYEWVNVEEINENEN